MEIESFISVGEIDSYLDLEDRINLGCLAELAKECTREQLEEEFNKACAIMIGLLAREQALQEQEQEEVYEIEIEQDPEIKDLWAGLQALGDIQAETANNLQQTIDHVQAIVNWIVEQEKKNQQAS